MNAGLAARRTGPQRVLTCQRRIRRAAEAGAPLVGKSAIDASLLRRPGIVAWLLVWRYNVVGPGRPAVDDRRIAGPGPLLQPGKETA